ncbi:hypothetical protein AA313_de0204529 [Arthrobotrys entomopaga]|nr:hypothetical protein AA313_de0204529 [Arthrobotrys entomopaga]
MSHLIPKEEDETYLMPRPKAVRHFSKDFNPENLVGKYVIGFLDDYPLSITLPGGDEPVEIHFGGKYGGGKDFEYKIDGHLRAALERAARFGSQNPCKIIAAHTAEATMTYSVPPNRNLPQYTGKQWNDKLSVVGLRIEGMKEMGYIWGEDVEKAWEETCLYCGTYITSGESMEENKKVEP